MAFATVQRFDTIPHEDSIVKAIDETRLENMSTRLDSRITAYVSEEEGKEEELVLSIGDAPSATA